MSLPSAERDKNGNYRVWLRIEFHPVLQQLADYLWEGLRYEETVARGNLTAKRVDEAVRTSMARRGDEWFAENDDAYEKEGGREWALEHVKRVYKFPKEGA